MERDRASVAQAKNSLSSLINKVAYGKARIVLESHGKPKAALISTEDLEKLEQLDRGEKTLEGRFQILAQAQTLRQKICRRRGKPMSDSAKLLDRLREQRSGGL